MRCNNAMGIDFFIGGVLGIGSAVGLRQFPVQEDVPGYLAVGLFVLYFFFGNSLPGGSLGMRLFGLQVISARTGLACNPFQAFIRVLFHPLHLGNALARTRVVHKTAAPATPSDASSPVRPS
jgi:uncharacterized RDD family membrane protein YckC